MRTLYFCPVVSSIFFFLCFSSPNLGGRRLDVYHTSTHGVALVQTIQTYVTNTHNHTTRINLVCTHHILWAGHLYGAQVGVHPKWNKPAVTPGPQNVTSLWLVLISRPNEDRRLSWSGWLGEILVVYPPKDDHPFPQQSGIELATIESQFRHPNQNTKPLLYIQEIL